MTQDRHSGNTLTEYGIVLGLLAVATIGTLSLLGNSVSKQLEAIGQGDTYTGMAQLANLNFNGGAGGKAATAANSNGSAGTGMDGMTADNNGGASINATSTDGAQSTVLGTRQVAREMLSLANQTNDPYLKQWYRNTANQTLALAESQANYEVNVNHYQDPVLTSLSQDDAAATGTPISQIISTGSQIYNSRSDLTSYMLTTLHTTPENAPQPYKTALHLADYVNVLNNNRYGLEYNNPQQTLYTASAPAQATATNQAVDQKNALVTVGATVGTSTDMKTNSATYTSQY